MRFESLLRKSKQSGYWAMKIIPYYLWKCMIFVQRVISFTQQQCSEEAVSGYLEKQIPPNCLQVIACDSISNCIWTGVLSIGGNVDCHSYYRARLPVLLTRHGHQVISGEFWRILPNSAQPLIEQHNPQGLFCLKNISFRYLSSKDFFKSKYRQQLI